MPTTTERIPLPSPAPGTERSLLVHHYGRPGARPKVYVQAALHANEIPGLLVAQHLLLELERFQARERSRGRWWWCRRPTRWAWPRTWAGAWWGGSTWPDPAISTGTSPTWRRPCWSGCGTTWGRRSRRQRGGRCRLGPGGGSGGPAPGGGGGHPQAHPAGPGPGRGPGAGPALRRGGPAGMWTRPPGNRRTPPPWGRNWAPGRCCWTAWTAPRACPWTRRATAPGGSCAAGCRKGRRCPWPASPPPWNCAARGT